MVAAGAPQTGTPPVIYLTGAPASGKTTLAVKLAAGSNVEVFSYGAELTDALSARVGSQDELRTLSAKVIDSELVQRLDDTLTTRISTARQAGRPLVIDSHAVTKEDYGFRAVPYSADNIGKYGISCVVCLYCDPSTIERRIFANAGGRPLPSHFEVQMHTDLQASLALSYAHSLGCPVHFVDSGRQLNQVVRDVTALAKLSGS